MLTKIAAVPHEALALSINMALNQSRGASDSGYLVLMGCSARMLDSSSSMASNPQGITACFARGGFRLRMN